MATGLRRVRATAFQKNPGRYQAEAMARPVVLTHHGKDRLVVLSYDAYKQLCQAAIRGEMAGRD